jgi:hypothetical protein
MTLICVNGIIIIFVITIIHRDFALFNVCSPFKNCPPAKCASAANVICKDLDVFGARKVLLSHFE